MAKRVSLTSPGKRDGGWALTIDDRAWTKLRDHLFPGDDDEHGAILLAGQAQGRQGLRLLVREVIPARDGIDYVPGRRGYRALDPKFIAQAARRARDGGWAYLAVHCHRGSDYVAFSSVDSASHDRGYPALLQIIGRPVGGLVVAKNAVAGDLWLPDGSRSMLRTTTILGRNIITLTPEPVEDGHKSSVLYDRQARMFGEAGQYRLASMRVGVVGLGGAGSMAAEMLARLGVGELVLIDPDRIEPSNLPRVVGSRYEDLIPKRSRFFRMGSRRGSNWQPPSKVDIAARSIELAGLPVEVTTMPVTALDLAAVSALCRCDWVVLAADTQQARHLINAIAHAYMLPVVQIGVKVPVDEDTGQVGQIFTVARRIISSSGCLWCNGLINPTNLQLEATGAEGKRARAYVGTDAPTPSVITLNGISVSMAITDLLLSTTGLLGTPENFPKGASYMRFQPRVGRLYQDEPRQDPDCLHCGDRDDSLRSRGDDAQLPVPLRADR